MQFVWFYVPAPNDGLELKLSMRSVMKNFVGETKITLICDDKERPKWYRGHSIHCPRVGKIRGERPDRLPFRDTSNKIVVAANSSEVDEEFVHIMDDVYLIRPTTIEDLATPRFDPWYRANQRREWHRCIALTFAALRERGYPTLQAGTHLPHLFERQKLLQMFSEFDFPKRMLLFEILYSNRFRENAIPYPPFLHRLQRPQTVQQLNQAAEVSNVMNYVGSCWRKTMQQWLQPQFPDPANHEQ